MIQLTETKNSRIELGLGEIVMNFVAIFILETEKTKGNEVIKIRIINSALLKEHYCVVFPSLGLL